MKLTKSPGGSVFRKIAVGSWQTAGDPSVYGQLEIDMTASLALLNRLNLQSPVKIGVSELFGRATALVLQQRPEMNGMIKRGRIYLRSSVNLFYQVNVAGSADDPVGKATLLGLTIPDAEKKSLADIAQELKEKSQKIRSGEDNRMMRNLRTLGFLPWHLVGSALKLISFCNYDLNLPLYWFGLPKDSFGSVMITNVGGMGVDTAWAPLVPYTRVPLLFTIGAIKDRAWAVNGQVVVRPVMRIGCTFDHRFMDGVHAAEMTRLFYYYFENPELLI